MAHRILLADSDREWLQKARNFLTGKGYKVDPATNGKDAQLYLYRNNYFAVVMGLGLRNHSGMTVLRFIRTHRPHFKVIALWNRETDRIEEGVPILEELNQCGIDHILPKTGHFRQLEEELSGLKTGSGLSLSPPPDSEQSTETEEDVWCDDNQFFKVKREEFYTSPSIVLNVFIRRKKSHYKKIFKAGTKADPGRLKRYRNDPQISWLHFKKKDLGKYVKFQNFLAGRMVARTHGHGKLKLGLFQNVVEKYWEQFLNEGINANVLEQGKRIAHNIADLIDKEESMMEWMCARNSWKGGLPTHTFLTTLLATAIMKKFQWHSSKTLETMALACLLHDIGMSRLPPDLTGKKTQEMSHEELRLYRRHPEIGAELVGDTRPITDTVKQIILQHHEYYDGTGHPKGKSRKEIIMPANILCLVDDFVHTVVECDCSLKQAQDIFLKKIAHFPTRYHPTIVGHFATLFDDKIGYKKSSESAQSYPE